MNFKLMYEQRKSTLEDLASHTGKEGMKSTNSARHFHIALKQKTALKSKFFFGSRQTDTIVAVERLLTHHFFNRLGVRKAPRHATRLSAKLEHVASVHHLRSLQCLPC